MTDTRNLKESSPITTTNTSNLTKKGGLKDYNHTGKAKDVDMAENRFRLTPLKDRDSV
jgi:hypothetical protein